MINISGRIIELRSELAVSQQDLDEKLGFAKNSISRFESGKLTPNKPQQQAIADFFGVSLAYLRGETNDKTRQDSWMDMTYQANAEEEKIKASISKPNKIASSVKSEDFDDSAFITALLKSKAAQDVIRKIVREELSKNNRGK